MNPNRSGTPPSSELKALTVLGCSVSLFFLFAAVKYRIAPVIGDETPVAFGFILLVFGPAMLLLSLFAGTWYTRWWRLAIVSPLLILLVATAVATL